MHRLENGELGEQERRWNWVRYWDPVLKVEPKNTQRHRQTGGDKRERKEKAKDTGNRKE